MTLTTMLATGTAFALLFATGCGQSSQTASTHDADIKAITADVLRWKSDFHERDIQKLLSHYADDTVVVIPGAPAAKTAETRRALVKGMIDDPALDLTTLDCPRVEVAASGDLGFAQCTYVMNMTDPIAKKPITDRGVVVEVYKKQADGSWKSVSDTAVSELPPVPPAK